MPASFRNLRAFISLLRREGELREVRAAVSSDQEIPEIHRRVIAAGGPALLFTNVDGGRIPVVTNLFGTRRRVDLAFGPRPLHFVREMVRFAHEAMPPTPRKLWGFRHLAWDALSVGLKRVSSGPVCEVVERTPDLNSLPLLKLWPADGGHFLTLPNVYTERPQGEFVAPPLGGTTEQSRLKAGLRTVGGGSKESNLGIYRMQRYDATTTGMHWQIGKGGGFHYNVAEARGESLPATVFLGGPPAMILAAIAPLPEGIPEMMLASLMVGERLRMCKNPAGGPHALLAEAEFALVGDVPPRERHLEGPFGDHYGYYSLTHDYPVFHCRAICRRRDAIMPATVVGKPRQEDFHIGEYLQELLSPLFPLVMPAVRDLWSYGDTGFHSLAAAVVKDRYGREAMMSAFRILGEGQLSLTKFLLVTDTPIDLRDFRAVLEHILARTNVETDLYVFSHLSMDTLDYTGPEVNKGSKGVWLGLGEAKRELPREWTGAPPAGTRDPVVFCAGCLVLWADRFENDAEAPRRVAADAAIAGWPLVIICDNPRHAAASPEAFLWTVFTRFEPAADIHSASESVVRRHPTFKTPLVIDARMKPWFPEEVFASVDIKARVEKRWTEYFPSGMEMGSSE